MKKLHKPWALLPVFLGGLLIALPSLASDEPLPMPSEKALANWDKNFHPGYYEVADTPLDSEGQPIAKDGKTSKQCFSKQDLKTFARTPFTMVPAKGCRFKLDFVPLSLTLSARCQEVDRVLDVVSAVGVDQDQQEYNLATVKLEKMNSGGTEMTYGKGKRLKYLGACP